MKILTITSQIAAAGRLLSLFPLRCSTSRLRVIYSLFCAMLLLPATVQSAIAAPINLSSDTEIATAGYYQLHWKSERPVKRYVLQESRSQDFDKSKIIYQGNDLARVISGKSNNVYYYRVIDRANPLIDSNIVKVTVSHHPLTTAFSFFSIGALVFLATLIVVFRGNRQG